MNEKALTKTTYIINSILFFVSGLILIIYRTRYINLFHLVISSLLIVLGFTTLILNIIKTKKSKDIFSSFTTLLTGLFFLYNKTKFLSIFPILFGIYMLMNGIGKFMTYIIYKNKENLNYYNVLLGSLIDFIFSYIMITSPSKNINRLTIYSGIYIMLFGLTYFYDFLKEIFPSFFGKKRRLRVTLPIILSTFIPYRVLLSLNKFINSWSTPVKLINKNTSGKTDLEILIHVRDDNIGKIGHADLCYKGIVYSYGCYDEESKKLFGSIGNGTLFEIKGKKKYIKYCNKYSNKTIFSFGITLTDEENKKVEEKINFIKSNTYEWNPLISKKKNANEYAIELTEKTDAKFYKFNKTSYKTYFLMFTNCVKLVDDVVGATGSDILKINGAISPGVYYDYLEREFKRKNSKVIKKEIYTNNRKDN